MNNFTNYSQIWMYQAPFMKVLMESLEVALTICNRELPEFTSAKLFDIMNQIIPTGFVLTTGYWPFYSSSKKQSLCVCGRFSLDCRHSKQPHHWIDLDPIPNDYSVRFCPRKTGPLQLTPMDINAHPVTSPPVGFLVTMQLKFTSDERNIIGNRRAKRGRPSQSSMQETYITISGRYVLKCEWYPAFRSILFQPNPYFIDFYGLFVRKLLVDRERLTQNPHFNYSSLFVETNIMPQFTVVMDTCDVPLYAYPNQFTSANYNFPETTTKYVETELEVWKYSEKIAKCSWNGPPDENNNVTEVSFDIEGFVKQFCKGSVQAQVQGNADVKVSEQPKMVAVRRRKRKLRFQQPNAPTNITIVNNDVEVEIAKVPPLVELDLQWLEELLQ